MSQAGTTSVVVEQRSALEVLASKAATDPDALLIRCLDTEIDYTNRDVLEHTLRWAGMLSSIGVGPGTVVAVMQPLGVDSYHVWLGAAWLRSVEVPINTDYRGAMLVHILTTSGARTMVCHSQYLERLSEVADQLHPLEMVVVPDDGPLPDGLPWNVVRSSDLPDDRGTVASQPPGPEAIAAVVYTSGTTGPSKGVMVPWRELSGFTYGWPPEVRGDGFRLYSPWPLFHVNGKFAFVETVNRGGSMVLRSRWRTPQFWPDVRENDVTAAVILGGVSHFLWSAPPADDDAANPLEHIMMAPVLPQFREFESRFGVKIHTGFASSEAGQPCFAWHPLPNHRTCGQLADGFELRLIDADGVDVPPNQMGEAVIRSEHANAMSQGYWRLPETTAWQDGWFHSGDGLMRDEDGYYYYVDRVRDSLRRRGENISSWELESLVGAHAQISECAAIAVSGEAGDVDEDIMIVVVPSGDGVLTPEDLMADLQQRVPRFMIPRYIRFAESLPRTHTGRIRKVELREVGVTSDTWDRVRADV